MGLLSGKKTSTFTQDGTVVLEIPLKFISPDPKQPRRKIKKIKELAESIISTKGIQSPIHVLEKGKNQYQIITGERRYHAAKYLVEHGGEHCRLGETVPCIVHAENELDEQRLLQLQVIENLQREDLTPLEEARAYSRLVEEGNMTQTQVAKQLGVSKSLVSETIKLLSLPKDFLDQMEEMEEMPPKRELFKIIREKDEKKQQELILELLKDILPTEEEESILGETQEPNSQNETKITEDDVWELLKKAVKKDKSILFKIISKSKIEKLKQIVEENKNT